MYCHVRRTLTFASVVLVAAVLTACATKPTEITTTYPNKPVRIVVPISAGSGVDIIARAVAERLTLMWGQQVSVENHPGAGGTIGTAAVAKSAPDGYTLLANTSGYAANPSLYKSLPYDPLKDLIDVAGLASLPNVLVVSSKADIKSLPELLTAVRARPGQLTYGSAGIGTGVHLNAEKFKLEAGLDIVHLPANGGPEAIANTESGRVAFFFAPVSIALTPIREGKLLALAVSSSVRSSLLPDVPTVSEAGVPGFEFTLWNGLWAPARTPKRIVSILERDVARALASPELTERFKKLGITSMNMSQPEFARFVSVEMEDSARIVKAAGIKAQ